VDLHLNDRIALVSGSSRGIGRSIARGLMKEGATVYLTARDEEQLKETYNECSGEFRGRVHMFAGDLGKTRTIRTLIDQIIEEHGRLDIVVANIGSGRSQPGWDVEDRFWVEGMDINFHPAVRLVREAIRVMLPRKIGSIVVISSIAACEAIPAPVPYSVAKTALLGFVKNISNLVGPDGIRINSISPGNVFFKGGTWDRIIKEKKAWVDRYIKESVPMQRLGTPEEIADAVCFLSSERAAFITGTNLIVDGGQVNRIL
jgi:3-oxoacyl-[acyl-carrier protein] reductase